MWSGVKRLATAKPATPSTPTAALTSAPSATSTGTAESAAPHPRPMTPVSCLKTHEEMSLWTLKPLNMRARLT
eukprot:738255-Prymnesium_polylepis.1